MTGRIKVIKRVDDVDHSCSPLDDPGVRAEFASGATEVIWRCPVCRWRWGVRGRGTPATAQAPARLTLLGWRYPR